jgi:hypothetical protein
MTIPLECALICWNRAPRDGGDGEIKIIRLGRNSRTDSEFDFTSGAAWSEWDRPILGASRHISMMYRLLMVFEQLTTTCHLDPGKVREAFLEIEEYRDDPFLNSDVTPNDIGLPIDEINRKNGSSIPTRDRPPVRGQGYLKASKSRKNPGSRRGLRSWWHGPSQ